MKYIIQFKDGFPPQEEFNEIVKQFDEFINTDDKRFLFADDSINIIEVNPIEDSVELKKEENAKD
tara:strand:+ start:279 stop:473 length:195 start_codon:yes stop_codon:yes gene_type:complete